MSSASSSCFSEADRGSARARQDQGVGCLQIKLMSKTVELAKLMRVKSENGSDPYVLVLGAGASVSSGTSLNRAIVERFVGEYNLDAFDKFLDRCDDDDRFLVLRDFVEGMSPSEGYHCLARLIRRGYFNLILSTNFDPLLEDAIARLSMRRRDYITLVHGVMEPELVASHLDKTVPRVKIFKLHGDLFYRKFYYKRDEIEEFPSPIGNKLKAILNGHDLVIIGHGMRDSDINRCLTKEGSPLWYVNPSPPAGEIAEYMESRGSESNVISGDNGCTDAFFSRLYALLMEGTAEVSVDAIGQVIYSISPVDGKPVGSGFLLGSTSLLVTDSAILATLNQGFDLGVKAEVRSFAGRNKRQAKLVLAPEKGIDYAVFRILERMEDSPLELADYLPAVGEPVTACIPVGASQGFRDGRVTAVNRSGRMEIPWARTIETIDNLVETDVKVEPGVCGSPLVAKDGRVVGVLVAAGKDRSYALTAVRLREMLAKAGLLSGDR